MTWTGDHKHFYRFKKWVPTFRGKDWMKFECDVEGCKDWHLVEKGFFNQ